MTHPKGNKPQHTAVTAQYNIFSCIQHILFGSVLKLRFHLFDVPFGYAYRDFSRLELEAYRDEHFVFGTVDNGIVGKELGEVDFGQRLPIKGGAQADVHVLVVLVTHYIGTGREQRFPGLVFGFKQIVGRFPAGPVLEIGTGRDSAYLKHRHRACAVSRDGTPATSTNRS